MTYEKRERAELATVIESYRSSINAACNNEQLRDMDIGELASLSEACESYLNFGRLVDAVVSGRLSPERNVLIRESTPQLLLTLGLPDLPWVMTQKHIMQVLAPKWSDACHGHGLTRYGIKRLPELIERPAAVFDNPRSGIVCVLADRDPDGLQLVMPFDPATEDRSLYSRGSVNFVLSLYGTPASNLARMLGEAQIDGRLVYVDPDNPPEPLAEPGELFLPASGLGPTESLRSPENRPLRLSGPGPGRPEGRPDGLGRAR